MFLILIQNPIHMKLKDGLIFIKYRDEFAPKIFYIYEIHVVLFQVWVL